MLASFFAFVRDMAWELVVLQLNPLLMLVLAGTAGIAAWGVLQLRRR